MTAAGFINQYRVELNEKSEHWSDEELYAKLQRSYKALQLDVPFAMAVETIGIVKDINQYDLSHEVVKHLSLKIGNDKIPYANSESMADDGKFYGCDRNKLILSYFPTQDGVGEIAYRYAKTVTSEADEIDLPMTHEEALVLLWKSKVYEKPIRNTKERDLSSYYLKLYDAMIVRMRRNKDTATAAYIPYKKV